jgi:hypothetical protein
MRDGKSGLNWGCRWTVPMVRLQKLKSQACSSTIGPALHERGVGKEIKCAINVLNN